MDQELLTFLKEQFHDLRQRSERVEEQIGGLREETRERFEKVDEQIGGLREETRERFEKVDERFETVEVQIGGLREESQEGTRHTHVLVEGVRGEVRLLAEGMMGLDHRMGRTQIELNRKLDDLRTLVTPLYRRMDERVTHLEEREDEKTRDVMDVIRERYGTPPDS
jgi:DNA repair exonuclease SbcCD ATPase subunit